MKISEAVKAASEDDSASTQDLAAEAEKSGSQAIGGQELTPDSQEKTVVVTAPEQNNAASMMIYNLLGRE